MDMKRKHFLLIAGVLAAFFGVSMLASPGQMLTNMAHDALEARRVLQWMGVTLLSIGVINFLSRNDEGSPALRAVMIGNIVLHILGFGIDVYHQSLGFVQTSGVIMGAVVHGLLTLGFIIYLRKLPRDQTSSAAAARAR
jgi:hypothetical protein